MEQFNKRKEVSIRSYHKQNTLNLQTSFSMENKNPVLLAVVRAT